VSWGCTESAASLAVQVSGGSCRYRAFAYDPCQLNYMMFGNAVPHVHTHIVPRYPDDPSPGRPLPDHIVGQAPTLPAGDLAAQLTRLRHHLE